MSTPQEQAQVVVQLIDSWVDRLWDYSVDLGRIANATEEEVARLSPELQKEYHEIIENIIIMDIDEESLTNVADRAAEWIDKSNLDLEV